jgi:hypothetical protein
MEGSIMATNYPTTTLLSTAAILLALAMQTSATAGRIYGPLPKMPKEFVRTWCVGSVGSNTTYYVDGNCKGTKVKVTSTGYTTSTRKCLLVGRELKERLSYQLHLSYQFHFRCESDVDSEHGADVRVWTLGGSPKTRT